MQIFGRNKKSSLEAGKPITADDVGHIIEEVSNNKPEMSEAPRHSSGLPVNERRIEEPRKFTPEETAMDRDWREFNNRCSGVFNPVEISRLTPSERDTLFIEVLFSIWREVKELKNSVAEE